jgi:hypothetical protein
MPGGQFAGLDLVGLNLLAAAEVLRADRVPYTLDAARVRYAYQRAAVDRFQARSIPP